jgi:CheY-like chemotaxis protein
MDQYIPGRPIEILLVEDSADDIQLTHETFRRDKIHNPLHVAQDGEIAMNMLRQKGEYAGMPLPDLILLDLNMPNKNGYEVLKELKADPDLCRIPVVILTSSKAETDIVKTYQLQADNYVVKPVNLEKLLEIASSTKELHFSIVMPSIADTLPPDAPAYTARDGGSADRARGTRSVHPSMDIKKRPALNKAGR